MSPTELCQLPPEPAGGCCDPQIAPAAVPLPIDHPPELSAIGYRIGTFTSFRRTMLDRVTDAGRVAGSPPVPGPFANWREGADGDYQTVFIELWAYLADILTFYQERIANEAYLGTATQRDSSRLLAQLVNYRPVPGAGASGLVAFSLARGRVAIVPQGFRLASRAQPGRAAAVFETSSPLTARAEHNAIRLSVVAPTNQFAHLSSFARVFVAPGAPTSALAEELYYGAGDTFLGTLPALSKAFPALTLFEPRFLYRPFISETTRTIVLEGVNTRLAAGDYVLPVENEHADRPKPSLYQLSSVSVDRTSNTTTIKWQEPEGTSYEQTPDNPVALYAMRVKASPFGSAAPNWFTLSPTLTMGPPAIPPAVPIQVGASPFTYTNNDGVAEYITFSGATITNFTILRGAQRFTASVGTVLLAPGDGFIITYTTAPAINKLLTSSVTIPPQSPSTAAPPYVNWDDPNDQGHFINEQGVISLDAVYDTVRATPDNPGWVALVGSAPTEIHPFAQAQAVALTDYALNAKVTQLTLKPGVTAPQGHFGIRDTLILTGAEKLSLHDDLPLPDPVQGDTLILDGLYPNLQDGQSVIVSGNRFDPSGAGGPGEAATEVTRLSGPPLKDSANNLTTVKLKGSLANHYVRSTTVLLANIAAVTQGETVKDEVLGSSDGSPLQSYPLNKQPLTYLPSTNPRSESAVNSTLSVTVNGVQWTEKPTLLESGPAVQDFTATEDDSGRTTVTFGDGANGMRPPTGTNNIHARYRIGLGRSGNVPSGSVQQLVDSLAGLQQVSNPQLTIGGTDPESLAGIRTNAPNSVRTFDRAVSAGDYAAIARTFPGIAKASARWALFDENLVALAHPYIQLTVAATGGTPISQGTLLGQLRSFLDQRRDPNVPLRILDFSRIYVDIAVTIDLDDRVPRQATFARVQAALNPGLNPDGTAGYFAFDSLDFGESLHLSAIYAFIQNILGVRDANVTRFRRMDQDPNDPTIVRSDILIGPTEIAVIGNDPNHPEQGLLTILQGSGGFIDT
jgi:predicted phage baseplate assembly protein